MTNLRGVRFGEIREKEKQKEDNGGWEKMKVKEDKSERNMWLGKKREVKKKKIKQK